MNQHQPYSNYNGQQAAPYGYSPANAASSFATTAYTYPPNIPQQIHQQQTSTPQQPQQQSNPQSSFFPQLPQGVSRQSQPQQQQLQQPQQRHSLGFNDGAQSVPSTPGNGPGAPAPDPDSPVSNYEENLMNALRREAQTNQVDNTMNDDDDDDDQMDEDGDEPIYQLPPPPEAIYPNEVELEKAIHAWSLEHGYELVRRASKKNARNLLYKRYFHCSKHGKVAPPKKTDSAAKVRVNRKSNRIGCPMSLAAVAVDPHDPSGDWQIRHRKTHHNHPAVDAIKLAGHRRRARNGEVERAVDGLFVLGRSTGEVLKWLQHTHPDGLFSRTDVANMKLKYKKYGTCCQRDNEPSAEVKAAVAAIKTGFPSACMNCRQKKQKCDSVRPVCGGCTKSKVQCKYDHDPHPRAQIPEGTVPLPQPRHARAGASRNNQTPTQQPTASSSRQPDVEDSSVMDIDDGTIDPSFVSLPQSTPASQQNGNRQIDQQSARRLEQALAALTNFQTEHVKPTKLSLESSSVEVLANSTCGNGDSYKTIMPRQFSLGLDWRQFKDNFLSAAVKENTYDVLIGEKKEPAKPDKPPTELPVEEHNEYIKQLAIFRRRNEMLKVGIKESLHPSLWSRVNLIRNAHDIWTALEDMCMPRGSDQAFTRFNELLTVTLSSCGNFDNYVHTLESKHHDFNQMAHHHDTRRPAAALNQSNAERSKREKGGNGTFPEELLTFLFLRGLGPQHQTLAANLCKKNNIGGYGSGERLGFKDLTMLVKRAMEWEAQRVARGA